MYRSTIVLALAAFLAFAASRASAETLQVGPGQKYAKPSEAVAAAHDGDLIEIDARGDYAGDVMQIAKNNLTLRGVGQGRAKIQADGKHAKGKGIWVISGHDTVVENIEFSGARVPDKNGAGIRPDGKNLTVRNCRFYDCQNGILGGGGQLLIEGCEFDHCGIPGGNGEHSVYTACDLLIFQHNWSHHTMDGHLLKSRAKESRILYNRLTDEEGLGSAVIDLPNAGYAIIVGNLMHKGAKGHNDRMIAYGMEGFRHARNALYVVNNTMVYEHRRPTSYFVRVEKAPESLAPVIRNNLCIGKIQLTNSPKAVTAANLLFQTPDEAGLVDPANYDYRLKAGSPAIDKGVAPGMADEFDLTPKFQYVHPYAMQPRPTAGAIDVGAYEFVPAGK